MDCCIEFSDYIEDLLEESDSDFSEDDQGEI